MVDWVHCNTCFRQPKSSLAFSLTNCGHLFCSECLSAMKGKCKMCGSPFMAIPITSQMKPDVQIFFTDPAELERKHNKTILQVMDFQKTHRQRFIAHLQKQQGAASTSALQQQLKQLRAEAEKRVTSLMHENAQLKQMLEGRMGVDRSLPMTPKSPHYRRATASRTPSPHSAMSTTPTQRSSMMAGGSKTPGGPTRLSVRTPPSNGRIGPVAGRPVTSEPAPLRTPSVMSNFTTGKTPDIQKAIPMDLTSPSSSRAVYASGALGRRDEGGGNSTSPARWDPEGRQIHLNYQPKSAVWQKRMGVYTSPKS